MDVYFLENAVRSFFDGDISPNVTKSACYHLGGGPILPFTNQGQFSYTVSSSHTATEFQ